MPLPRPLSLSLRAALMAVMVLPASLAAQVVSIGEPDAVFPEDFGTIQNVRELPDGRVLVADPLGKALYAVDLDTGRRDVVGSEGEGPEEYLQPDAVWPLPGDSTLLIDLGNGRIVALGPTLEFGPTMPIAMGDPRPGNAFVIALPQGVDGSGNIYVRSMGGGFGGELPDSAPILRINRDTRAIDTVASFKLQERRQTTTGGPNNQNVSVSPIPLSPEDAWGIAGDGSIVLARSGDYHVEWISPNGSMTRGAPIPWDPERIGTAEKEEFVAAQGRNGGGISVSVGINNGAVQTNLARGGAGGAREIDQYEWPDRKPAFYGGRLSIDTDDRVWVRRHVDAGAPSTYDVFDRSGARVATVALEHGKRIVGFGQGVVYVVAFDQFDLNYLERYTMPAI